MKKCSVFESVQGKRIKEYRSLHRSETFDNQNDMICDFRFLI